VPVEQVEKLLRVEVVKLEQTARIKTFVTVLAGRSVKNQLREQNGQHDADLEGQQN